MVPLSLRAWLKPPRHLLALFIVVIVVPAVALAWLAARTIEQDAALARQRVQDRLDGAARAASRSNASRSRSRRPRPRHPTAAASWPRSADP